MVENTTVALRLVEVLAGRLQEARDAYQRMAFNNVTGQLAALPLRLADEETDVVGGYSHQELAGMVGCLRESLTTTLDRIKGSQAVETGQRRVSIIDRPQLERLVRQRSIGPTSVGFN